jgi:hypothetical protein
MPNRPMIFHTQSCQSASRMASWMWIPTPIQQHTPHTRQVTSSTRWPHWDGRACRAVAAPADYPGPRTYCNPYVAPKAPRSKGNTAAEVCIRDDKADWRLLAGPPLACSCVSSWAECFGQVYFGGINGDPWLLHFVRAALGSQAGGFQPSRRQPSSSSSALALASLSLCLVLLSPLLCPALPLFPPCPRSFCFCTGLCHPAPVTALLSCLFFDFV